MTYYNSSSGLWNANGSNPPWWQSAIALQAIIDWTQYASATEYLVEAYNTVEMQKNVLPWWPEGQGHFRADSTDDTAWWALALLSLYELTDDVLVIGLQRRRHLGHTYLVVQERRQQ